MYKRSSLSTILLFACLFALTSADFQDIVSNIESVSTSATTTGGKWNYISLQGGAYLYIRGTGFSTRSALSNRVTLDETDCPIIEYMTTSTLVVCQAPPSDTEKAVTVKVFTDDIRIATCPQCITYSYANTPLLAYMLPNAANPGQNVSYYGKERVSTSLDVDYVKIGNDRCDPSSQNEFDAVTFDNGYNMAYCDVPLIEAGYYNVTQRNLLNTGFARKLRTVLVYNKDGSTYDFAIVPKITSLNTNVGSPEGQIITVKGRGFSSTGNNEIKLADTPCVILKQTQTSIDCEVQPRSTPIPDQGYHAGLTFEFYPNKDIATVKAGTATPKTKESVLVAEIPYNNGEKYSSKLYGYFTAPVTGTYKFAVSADDKAELYIVTTSKSNPQQIIYIGGATPYKFYFASNPTTQISAGIDLEAGKSYYMELYHNEISGADFASVGVYIPSTPNDVSVVPEVQIIKINCPADPEIWEFKTPNIPGGTWKIVINYYNSATKIVEKTVKTASMDFNVKPEKLADQLSTSMGIKVKPGVYKTLDANGIETTVTTEIKSFVYQAEFVGIRRNNAPLLVETPLPIKLLTPVQTQAPSPLLKGTFSLTRGTKTVQLNYNADTSTVEAKMKELGFNDPIRIARSGDVDLGAEWRIQFSGEDGNAIPDLIVQQPLSLDGCKNPLDISVSVNKLQTGSKDLFYEAIPFNYLSTYETAPQITIKSNGITGNCPKFNCNYVILPNDYIPEVTSATYTRPTLVLAATGVSDIFSITDIRVFLGNTECRVDSYLSTSSPVSIVANCPKPEAGDYYPKVHFNRLGYARMTAGLAKISIPLVITSVTPNQINSRGGTSLTVAGRGYPATLDIAKARGMTVKIGTSDCLLNTVTPTQITCTNTPVSAAAPLTITLNQKTTSSATLTLIPIVPVITSVSPNSVNPVLQTDITITGTDFDTTITNTKVFLGNSTNLQVQECLPVSSTSTEITCKLLGAPTGTYDLYVKTSLGFSNSQTFEVKTVINSISPSEGSNAGGTLLTIQGGSFSNENQQTLVFIGLENIMCDVVSSSANQVQCITRAKPSSYDGSPQDVVVATRIVEESLCENGGNRCAFSYSDALTPHVTDVSPSVVTPGDSLQITGTGLDSNPSSTPVVTIDGVNCVVTSSSDTQITVTLPTNVVPNVNGTLVVNVAGKGNAQFDVSNLVSVTPTLSGVSPLSGSRAGVLLTLTGTGFQTGAYVKVGTSVCEIRSLTETTIVCKATAGGEVVLSYKDFASVKCTTPCVLTQTAIDTPTITSVSPQAPSSPTFSLTIIGTFSLSTPTVRLISQTDKIVAFSSTITSAVANQIVASFSNVAAGTYSVEVASGANLASTTLTVSVPLSSVSATAVQSSIVGGNTLTILGTGFLDNDNKDKNKVTVCGLPCQVTQSSPSSIQCKIPTFVNAAVRTAYPNLVAASILSGTTWSDAQTEKTVFDLVFGTAYKSSQANCQIGVDFGVSLLAEVSEIKFYPNPLITASTLKDTVIEGSNDNTTYTAVATIDANAHDGWNSIRLTAPVRFRYYRLRGASSTAKCNLAELQYSGILLSENSVTNLNTVNCEARVTVNDKTQATATAAVNYRQSNTAVVSSISPTMGTTAGGTTLKLTGTGFLTNPSQVKVYIDDVECTVQTATTTQIRCLTGPAPDIPYRRSSLKSELRVVLTGKGNAVVNNLKYFYIDRWSDTRTWGGIAPPRAGESVSIPSGQTVLLDISPPKLKAIIVEGALIFDDANIDLHCDYIIIRNGRMQIGTSENRIQNKITVTLYGTKESPQLPTFGNKVIAMMEGILDIHGKERSHTWTVLDATANVGDTSIVVQGLVDWVAGETIVVASTEHDHYQSESRVIDTVTQSGGLTTITFTDPLEFKHYAGVQTIDGETFEMRAEVGLLTRNVVIQGDESSEQNLYGVHIMTHSSTGDDSSIGRISYAEVRRAGQAYNLGRYPIHFHMLGNVRESYVIGNAIHHTYNRAVTIHGVHFLKVQKNVAHWVMGHTIFIEDGIETHNVIEDNLVINTIASTALLNTDQTPASFWITNPNNIWRRNHAAGSDRYGFWFDLRAHPEGPSATNSICPTGEPLGEFTDNQAHSSGRYGLRIFHELIPRTYPCLPYQDAVANPPIQAEFTNFLGWKNMRDAVIGERLGAVKFKNIKAADNLRAGIEISDGNRSPPDTLLVEDAWIVGMTPDNAGDNAQYTDHQVRGLITPKVDFFLAKNIQFSNFGDGMTAIETCSHCEHPAATDSGARTAFFEGLKFNNVAQKVRFNVPFKEILVDRDGSLTGNTAGKGVVTFYYEHLDVPGCVRNEEVYNGLVCDETVTIRRVEFINLDPFASFQMQNLTIHRVEENPMELYGAIRYRQVSKSWATPFVTGYTYNLSWSSRADFNGLRVNPSDVIKADDKTITVVFNHTEYRELFDFTKVVSKTPIDNSTNLWDSTTAQTKNNGDWYHEPFDQLLYVAVNGQQKENFTVTAVKCRVNCPVVPGAVPKDGVIRLWSNPAHWPSGEVPKDGDTVEIPGSYEMKLDVNSAKLNTLIIKGDLYFDDTKDDLVLTAEKIWVQGNLFIGKNSDERYTKNAKIYLTGVRNSETLMIGPAQDASNKVLAVTGTLTMYGAPVNKVYVRLLAPAQAGANTITVPADTDWKVGDEIVIAPSQRAAQQHEVRKIQAINSGVITLNQSLSYYHYGAGSTTKTTNFGTIDMRTEVGLLTRNIVIEGSDEDSWGGRIYVSEVYSEPHYFRGRVDIDGVEMRNLGQPSTDLGGLTFDRLTSLTNTECVVRRSVVRDSQGWSLRVVGSDGITLEQNIFYRSVKYQLVWEETNTNIKFNNNLAIGNRDRGLKSDKGDSVFDYTAMFYGKEEFVSSQVSGNIFAGCDQSCLVARGGSDCTSKGPFTFYDNVAHSGETGWLVPAASVVCNSPTHFTGYKLQQGISSFFMSKNLQAYNILITDTEIGVSLNTGSVQEPTNISLKDSYIAGIILPSYSVKSECSDIAGIYISVSTTGQKSIPPSPPQLPWYKVKSDHIFQATFTVSNVVFENFKDDFVPGCTDQHIFKTNPYASDYSAITKVSGLTLNNIGSENRVFFTKANDAWITIDDCGGYHCTGIKNVLINDLDGTLVGASASLFPANPTIMDSTTCTLSVNENAHICKQKTWGTLTFESLDSDSYTRLISPVKVTTTGFENTLNSYMDHIWDGFYTGLRRLSRFHSVVQPQKAYKVSFTGTVPNGLRWQLQGALPTQSLTAEYGYTNPQVVRVLKKDGTEVKPFVGKTEAEKVITDTSACGTNLYNINTNKITIKLTGEDSCRLDVKIINAISASIRYSLTVEEFFAQNGPATFIDKVAAILKINPASIRIVDIKSGSTILSFDVAAEKQTNDALGLQEAEAELKAHVDKLQEAVQNGDLQILNSSILNSSFQVTLMAPEKTNNTVETVTSGNNIVVIIVASVVAAVALIVGAYFAHVKFRNTHNKKKVTPLKVIDLKRLPSQSTQKLQENDTSSNSPTGSPLMRHMSRGTSLATPSLINPILMTQPPTSKAKTSSIEEMVEA